MKRIKLLLLIWALLMPMMANADAVEIDGIYYNLISKAQMAEVTTNPNKYSGEVVIPETVTFDGKEYSVASIGGNAFYGCWDLQSVIIPNSVTSIVDYTFYGCSGLTSVTIPNSVTSIGKRTFYGCSGLTSVTIPNSVTSIGDYAFYACRNLQSVIIPNSVTLIGEFAFSSCSGLTSVHISDIKAWCNIFFANESSNPLCFANHLFLNGEEIKDLIIPNSVTSIGDYAFYGCSGLISVTIPNSVTSIGGFAFGNCDGLTLVTIPNSVTSIGNFAFSYCDGLTSVTIPKSVTSIGIGTFEECSSLTSVTIPNSVTYIGDSAFMFCSSLTSVTIPNSVTSIATGTFYNCSGLTSVTIGSGVKSIGKLSFYGCSGLTSVTIGSGVKSIGEESFSKCPELTDVYCMAKDVPKTSLNAFEGSYIEYASLHVPNSSVEAYKSAEPWSNFMSIVEMVDGKVELNKTKVVIEKGKSLTLTATVTSETSEDKSVTWESSDTKIATVSSSGNVKGVKGGMATITCTFVATGATATCEVTVGYVKLNETEIAIEKGKTQKLKSTVYPSTLEDRSVTWTSSDTKIATVSSSGKVKGVKGGTATITCTSNATGLSATCKVTVGYVKLNETEIAIEKGKSQKLKSRVYPSTLEDRSVTWESSNTKIATVSSSGKVKGVKYGTATITCTSVATGAKATCQVTVGKVIISMSEFSIKRSRTNMLTATVYPTDLADKSVTWKSSDESIATVSSSGKVKGVMAGTATITCTSVATGLKGTCTVTVLAVAEARAVGGDDDGSKDIKNIDVGPAVVEPYDVYDLSGRMLLHQVTSLDGLPNGIYIVNGKKILKK